MNVLAIDTATEVCGIGLLVEGKWFECARKAGLSHSEHVTDGIHRLLHEAAASLQNLDLIVCSRGPGSFTGLRIGMATAKGLAAGAGLPLVSVPTLDAMAFGLEWAPVTVVPVIDAKKNSIYTAAFKRGKRIRDPIDLDLGKVDVFIESLGEVVLTGPGADLTAGHLTSKEFHVDKRGFCWNRGYVEVGISRFTQLGQDAPDSGPEYLRKSDAEMLLDSGDLHVRY